MKMYGKERAELIYGLKSADEVDARICEMLFDDGAAFVGFSDVSDVAENHGYRSCVTVGFKLFDGILKGIQGAPTYEYFHHYRTVNAALDRMTLRVAAFLNSQGFDAIAIPASQSSDCDPFKGAFPHKTGARLSGAGYIGKNALFLSREFGAKVRLASVLTDKEFDLSRTLCGGGCGDCEVCKMACPAGAIYGKNYVEGDDVSELVDVAKCSAHMKAAYRHIGRGAVCGVCIAECPKSRLKNRVDK